MAGRLRILFLGTALLGSGCNILDCDAPPRVELTASDFETAEFEYVAPSDAGSSFPHGSWLINPLTSDLSGPAAAGAGGLGGEGGAVSDAAANTAGWIPSAFLEIHPKRAIVERSYTTDADEHVVERWKGELKTETDRGLLCESLETEYYVLSLESVSTEQGQPLDQRVYADFDVELRPLYIEEEEMIFGYSFQVTRAQPSLFGNLPEYEERYLVR